MSIRTPGPFESQSQENFELSPEAAIQMRRFWGEVAKWTIYPVPGLLIVPWLLAIFGGGSVAPWWAIACWSAWIVAGYYQHGDELAEIRKRVLDGLTAMIFRRDEAEAAPAGALASADYAPPSARTNAVKIVAVFGAGALLLWWLVTIGLGMAKVAAIGILGLALAVGLARIKGPWATWWSNKIAEWRRDLRHLSLWLRLASDPRADSEAHAAMAHQQQFLQGRALNPVRILGWVPLALAGVSIIFGLWHWRSADNARSARDKACSPLELAGSTSRQACADLTVERARALEWRAYAMAEQAARVAAEDRWKTQVVEAEEAARESAALAQRAQAQRAALQSRQRRRTNEAIEAALGGPAPDWDASLREFTVDRTEPDAGGANGSPGGIEGDAGDLPGGVPLGPGGPSGDDPADIAQRTT